MDPSEAVAVKPGDELDELLMMDLETGELFKRAAGSNGEQDTAVGPDDPACERLSRSPTCRGEPPDDDGTQSPEDAVRSYFEAWTTGDCDRAFEMISTEFISQIDVDLRAECLDRDSVLVDRLSSLEIEDAHPQSQDGDQAVVAITYRDTAGTGVPTGGEVPLVREDGQWKINGTMPI